MRKHTLSVLAAAAVGLTASMASAADLPRKAPAYVPPAGAASHYLDRMLHRRQRRRGIYPPGGGFQFWVNQSTTILALPVAVRLAAIINGPAVG